MMNIPDHSDLLRTIEDFRSRHDIAETSFGREAIGNPNFIRGLKEGVSPTLATLTRVRDYMAEKDAEERLRQKLSAEPDPVGGGEEEIQLPFSSAPVNATGASSPTSSPTTARPTSPAEPGSSRSTTTSPSCSGHKAEAR